MRSRIYAGAIAAILALAGLTGLIRSGAGLTHTTANVNGVPLHFWTMPGEPGAKPGVVVAHGFAGSARIMFPFAETLARRGFAVVLLDFSGHGASERALPAGSGREELLRQDLQVALDYLRAQPGVDPARIGLVGHSMGAYAVTSYALDHPEILATVAVSLPVPVTPPPTELLLLVGSAEFAGFQDTGTRMRQAGATLLTVPWTEHITILYASAAHQATADFLARSLHPADFLGAHPVPTEKLIFGLLLLTGLIAGLYPLAPIAAKGWALPYAFVTIAAPVHFGVTHSWPSGWRWPLMAVTIAGCFAFGWAVMFLSGGRFWRHVGISAAAVALLTIAAFAGLTPGFLQLVLPLLAVLLGWQSLWFGILTQAGAKPWLAVLAAAIPVAWPLATALPLMTL
jgi:pimeloyl-ACP methyl ester carboxylesterase